MIGTMTTAKRGKIQRHAMPKRVTVRKVIHIRDQSIGVKNDVSEFRLSPCICAEATENSCRTVRGRYRVQCP